MANKLVRLKATDDTNIDVLYVDNGDGTWSPSASVSAVDPLDTDPGASVLAPHEDGDGTGVYRDMAADGVKAAVLSGPGNLYGWKIHNPGTVAASLHLYNAATGDVIVGTTVPYYTIGPVPAGGWDEEHSPMTIARFDTAMTRAATQGGVGGVSGLIAGGEGTVVATALKAQLSVMG